MTDVVLSIDCSEVLLNTGGEEVRWPLGAVLAEIVRDEDGPTAQRFTTALAFTADRETRRKIGEELYEALLDGAPGGWAELLEAASEEHPLRVRIDVGCPQLAPLPWELMRAGRAGRRLWLDNRVLLRRGRIMEHPARITPVSPQGPLRVLLVVCNPEDPELLADCELAMVGAALADLPGRVHAEVIDGPSLPELVTALTQVRPHVLHFIGHGTPAVVGDRGGLHFNTQPPARRGDGGDTVVPRARKSWTLDAERAHHLYDKWTPRLVVLNACRQAHARIAAFENLVDTCLGRGSFAVLAMQADIQSPAAAEFSRSLYTRLAQGQSIDEAVRGVRGDLDMSDSEGPSWALPVLQCGLSDPAEVVPVEFGRREPELTRLNRNWPFDELAMFLGRAKERRIGWWEQCDQPGDPVRVFAITSAHRRSGKTWLAKWCLLTCMLRGEDVTYVDLTDPRIGDKDDDCVSMGWLEVVRSVRNACLDTRQPDPMAEADFVRFHRVLNRAARGGPAWSQQHPTPDCDQGHRFVVESDRHAETRKRQIIDAFLDVLRARAKEQRRSHVIALDQTEQIAESDFRNVLLPLLLSAVQESDDEFPLRVLVVAPQTWSGYRYLAETLPREPVVLTESFPVDEAPRLAREFWERKSWHRQVPDHLSYDDFKRLVDALPKNRQRFPVTVFHDLLSVLTDMRDAG
ncbi:CHAT domain-containing protein [Streptomyces sp. 7R007]